MRRRCRFPVAGTLMVEPTESEIARRARPLLRRDDRHQGGDRRGRPPGQWPLDDSPLRNAPHTADCLIGDWDHAYPRAWRPSRSEYAAAGQVLAARAAHRRGVRRSQPGVRLPAPRGARVHVIAVLDIDGVLADASHRQHFLDGRPKDWDAFFAAVGDDTVIEAGRARLTELATDHRIVLLSGRPERTRVDTQAWLDPSRDRCRRTRAAARRRPASGGGVQGAGHRRDRRRRPRSGWWWTTIRPSWNDWLGGGYAAELFR